MWARAIPWCDRRLFFLDFETFLFGTAMTHLEWGDRLAREALSDVETEYARNPARAGQESAR